MARLRLVLTAVTLAAVTLAALLLVLTAGAAFAPPPSSTRS
jgi:hypothetical protein